MNISGNILEIRDLDVFFETNEGYVKAVNKVSLNIRRGECIGIIGETGSGKSVIGQSVLRLLANNAHVNGSIYFHGTDLLKMDIKEMKKNKGQGNFTDTPKSCKIPESCSEKWETGY